MIFGDLKPEREKKHGPLSRTLERAFDGLLHLYDRMLQVVLRHQWITLGVTAATIVFTVGLYILVPKGLFPQQDSGSLAGQSQAPQDISFPAMKARTEALIAVLKQDPNIDHFVAFIGQGNTGNFFVQLKPWGKERKLTADQVIGELRPKLAQVSGITLFLPHGF